MPVVSTDVKNIGKVIGTTLVSQIISFLNAAFAPFKGTIFVNDDWEPMASRTAVAAGMVIVATIVALSLKSTKAVLTKHSKRSLFATLCLFGLCAGMYFLIKSGFAPNDWILFFLRDLVWMLIYILMLVMVGVTIAFAQLLLYSGGGGGSTGGKRTGSKAAVG